MKNSLSILLVLLFTSFCSGENKVQQELVPNCRMCCTMKFGDNYGNEISVTKCKGNWFTSCSSAASDACRGVVHDMIDIILDDKW